MKMDIRLFTLLNDIATKHGVSQLQWAAASGIPQPRISEFVRQSKGEKNRQQSRYFTLSRYISLYHGLRVLLGEATLKKAIIDKAGKETAKKMRVWAKLAVLLEAEEDKESQKLDDLERFVDLLNKD